MKKLPNKLAASVRKVKEERTATPAPSSRSQGTTNLHQTAHGEPGKSEAPVRRPTPDGYMHPARVWPD